ncbi:MAG: hypothetical protein IJ662_03455 [Clostridia bacterium]|nr:hypothetical protein [Clostridia bacterium]
MTQGQYKHEMMQKVILAHGATEDATEKLRLSNELASMINDFWTDERTLDYINYITAPNGTICAACKDMAY